MYARYDGELHVETHSMWKGRGDHNTARIDGSRPLLCLSGFQY